jgi:hypothetical protein
MTVATAPDGDIVLSGICPSQDADLLLQRLLEAPGVTVDWRACTQAHTAVVQVLMAARAPLSGPPAGAFLRQWVEPLLAAR